MQYKIVKLNTARNALLYLIKAYSIEKINLPYYLCFCMRNTAVRADCKIQFYHIDKNFRPEIEFKKNEFILYPNYFGVCYKIVEELSLKYKNLIVDNAHSFYSKPTGTASFNSLRKFFPSLRDGAFLYTKKVLPEDIAKDNFSYNLSAVNYEEICKNENRLDKEPVKYISDCTYTKYKIINHKEIKNGKIKKFKYWHNLLGSSNLLNFNLNMKDIPFGYPYLAKTQIEADKLAAGLKSQNIEIYRYWHNLPDNYPEKIFYTNLVLLF